MNNKMTFDIHIMRHVMSKITDIDCPFCSYEEKQFCVNDLRVEDNKLFNEILPKQHPVNQPSAKPT